MQHSATVELRRRDGKAIRVPAIVVGHFAMHTRNADYQPGGGWLVTHVPTGRLVMPPMVCARPGFRSRWLALDWVQTICRLAAMAGWDTGSKRTRLPADIRQRMSELFKLESSRFHLGDFRARKEPRRVYRAPQS